MPQTVITRAALIALTLVLLTGCDQEPSTDPSSHDASTSNAASDSPEASQLVTDSDTDITASVEAVDLTIATFDELQAAIAASKGRIVIVDYWSTSCPPCMTEFPGLVAIHNELPHDQVRCVSASLDYEGLADFPIEEARKMALEFLEQQKATLDNFIVNENSLTVMDEKLKIASIPAVFVFGVDGKLARQFDESSGESFSYEKDITPFVRELVKQSFPADSPAADQE
ncbi:MAG: TlpA family protein disulfide reductase [Rhodopirellula sp.]|nr:TlpA family protein disulfide reductase [Rhodopirellula sp.]